MKAQTSPSNLFPSLSPQSWREAIRRGRTEPNLIVLKGEAEVTVKAHQYLYYVLCRPVWSDYQYDLFCKEHDIEGGGGSDCADHYHPKVISLAHKILESTSP